MPSTDVFSYHAHRSPGQANRRLPGEQPAKRRQDVRRWIRLLPTMLSIGVIALSLSYGTILNAKPRFQVVNGLDTELLRAPSFYETEASAIMKRSVFNYSKLTINTTKLAQDLSAQYPELGRVSIIIPLSGRRPVIEVRPAAAAIKLSGSGGTYIIDKQGRALLKDEETASNLAGDIPYVIDQGGLQLEKGKQVLSLNTINFITGLTHQLKAKSFVLEAITLPAIPGEVHVRLKGQAYYIKFDAFGNPREQAGTFIAAHEKLAASGSVPGEYLDARVPEKAFYR